MRVTTRKCLAVMGLVGVFALYAAGAYRIEQIRQAPAAVACAFGHCSPTNASLAALR